MNFVFPTASHYLVSIATQKGIGQVQMNAKPNDKNLKVGISKDASSSFVKIHILPTTHISKSTTKIPKVGLISETKILTTT